MFSELGIILLSAISVIAGPPCGGIQFAYVCLPGNPTLYQLCIGGIQLTIKCPAGLYFNRITHKCDESRNTTCLTRSTSPPSTMKTVLRGHASSSVSAFFQRRRNRAPGLQFEKYIVKDSEETQPETQYRADACNSEKCKLPNCRCPGSDIPGGLPASQTPMMVMLTFDDSVNYQNFHFYRQLFHRNLRNPNGCRFRATFFVSGDLPEFHVDELYKMGMEIASHSQTHRFPKTWWAHAGYDNYVQEIEGMRKRLSNTSNIPYSDIKGMRVPFLQPGGDDQYQMLHDYNFLYDSSMVIGTERKLWPFTLDWAPDTKTCCILPCPQISFPGLWEIPLNRWHGLNNSICPMPDVCEIGPGRRGTLDYLNENFKRNYNSNRTPLGISLHSAWFTKKPGSFKGLMDFLQILSHMDDVWVITVSQVLDWVRNPVPLSEVNTIDSWKCE